MKNYLTILFLIMTWITFSAQFQIVSDIKELAGDITAQKFGQKDVNGQWCAILKIHSDIKDMRFEGFGYEKHDYDNETGIYLVYLQPQSKNLRFIKSDFAAKNYEFPYKLKSNSVYQMEVISEGEEKKIEDIAITIQTEPNGVTAYIDGEKKGISEQIKTSVGTHELKLEKEGFQSKIITIEVSASKTLFKEKLDEVQQVGIVIKSEPLGADVYIDGLNSALLR